MQTCILPVNAGNIGKIVAVPGSDDILDELKIEYDTSSADARNLKFAADQLRHSNIPVAFPTETVYGLGADATRSDAVRGIYKAKQRPADNPLIVHFASLHQLRSLLSSSGGAVDPELNGSTKNEFAEDPIPHIYRPLISKFWPGPLTIILPNSQHSKLAPEVTAGLKTFGARIPQHVLATALIQLAGVPIAAPSANASTRPSPTAAEHVAYDLNGRIETIIDGGPCAVGVESTVVDGLSQPPLILRPGGISLGQIRSCPGWEATEIGYQNKSEENGQPRAPGMKYRHYSPDAGVVLYVSGKNPPSQEDLLSYAGKKRKLGVVTTRLWTVDAEGVDSHSQHPSSLSNGVRNRAHLVDRQSGFAGMLQHLELTNARRSPIETHHIRHNDIDYQLLTVALGKETEDIARGIFSSLRELDRLDVDAILVEGIDDHGEGDTAAAVMNRLRKAAEIRIEG